MRPCFGRSGIVPASALAALLMTLSMAPATAQTSGDDRPSLARYVPKDDLLVYVEFDGIDAHADAWRKTAAYKILNETPTGAMLEDLLAQLVAKLPQTSGKVSGPEAVAVVKHLARSGFVLAMGGDAAKNRPFYAMLALRDAFKNKEVRPAFARALQGLNAPNTKPQTVTRAGHKVVASKMATAGPTASTACWWIEDTKKEDLIVVLPAPEATDFIFETLDGKHPNATEHPARVELTTPEAGLTPILKAFVSPSAFRQAPAFANLGLSDVTRLDFRGGFQDDALTTILRLATPKPHSGPIALLDGPSFDRAAMPAMPEGITNYSIASMNLMETFAKAIALAKKVNPSIEDQVKQASDTFKAKTKLRLREDILAHLGPRATWYVLPAKSGSPPTLAAPTAVGMTLAMMGIDQIPKLAMVIDIDNAAAFGKALDELMGYVNRELRTNAAKQAGLPAAEGGPARGNRGRASGAGGIEFRLMPGENKGYVLAVPPEAASQVPAAIRPAIRIVGKQVIIAINPEVARMAHDAKGPNTPPSELTAAFSALPSKLKFLSLADPRDTLPAVLAALPGKLQTGINTMLIKNNVPAANAAGSPSAPATSPAAAPPPGAMAGGGGGRRRGGSGEPGSPPGPSAPTPPAGDPAKAGAGVASVVLQVDPAKLPSADAIRALLFPSIFSVEEDGDGFKVTFRQAFPDLGDPSKTNGLDRLATLGIQGRPGVMPPGFVPPGMPSGVAPPGVPAAGQPAAPAAVPPPAAPGRPGAPGSRGSGRSERGPD